MLRASPETCHPGPGLDPGAQRDPGPSAGKNLFYREHFQLHSQMLRCRHFKKFRSLLKILRDDVPCTCYIHIMKTAWVYLLASGRNGTLYVGVTSALESRIWQHKHDVFRGFTRTYGVKTLVWFDTFDTIEAAIRFEKQLKRWRRDWKLALIEKENPDWRDLYEDFFKALPEGISDEARALNLAAMVKYED
jgi:putative endonuclease